MRFFETVQAIFNFFSGRAPRWTLLTLGEDNTPTVCKKLVLKNVCATRWEACYNVVFTLKKKIH
jgi:hypothetical protein